MEVKFRRYSKEDHEACMEMFLGNCPPYFDASEIPLFKNWLNALDKDVLPYDTIKNNLFYVGTMGDELVACGGFYMTTENEHLRLSWGMVQRDRHKKGLGKSLFEYRLKKMKELFPEHKLAMDTSQHTFKFYEKMGFSVKKITPNAYGEGLDKYDMEF